MRYGQIRRYDVGNGPGIRSSIFVTGCSHKCPGCFNEEYQDFKAGKEWTDQENQLLISYLSDSNVKGLTILGGEPFQNIKGLVDMIKAVKKEVDKEIWIYSGYLFEDLIVREDAWELLSLCDVLVDGLFIEEEKNLKLKFRGSENQRIIDLKQSLALSKPILMNI